MKFLKFRNICISVRNLYVIKTCSFRKCACCSTSIRDYYHFRLRISVMKAFCLINNTIHSSNEHTTSKMVLEHFVTHYTYT